MAWRKILKGEQPSLSIEITRECPLRCPGCYAYEPQHLGQLGPLKTTQKSPRTGASQLGLLLELRIAQRFGNTRANVAICIVRLRILSFCRPWEAMAKWAAGPGPFLC